MSSILVDTSFLITLADPTRRHHQTATTYLRESLKANIPPYLSSIVASEFRTLAKYLRRLTDAGQCSVRAILMVNGFDAAWLNGGQSAIPEI